MMLTVRRVFKGMVLLGAVCAFVLPGCTITLKAANGHWTKIIENGKEVGKKCDPGGTDCVVADVTIVH